MSEKHRIDSFQQGKVSDRFVVVRKNRTYSSSDRFPKVSIKRELYDQLATVANESGLSMSDLTGQAIKYALDRLEWVEE